MITHVDLAECLPDNTALQVSEDLSTYLVFSSISPPTQRGPLHQATCLSTPFATSLSSFTSLQPDGPIGCGDIITTTNTTTSATTTNHARSAENTRNTQQRTGKRKKGISAEEPGKRKHNPLPTSSLEPSLGETEPRENQEGLDTPEPQTPCYIILCKKLLSPLSYIHRSSWQV